MILSLTGHLACSDPAPEVEKTPPQATAQERTDAIDAAAKAISADFLKQRVNVLADDQFGGRDNLTDGNKQARAWLLADLAKLGFQPGFSGSGADSYEQAFAKGTNLCARLEGADPALRDQQVIVGAHYDGLGTVGAKNTQCKPAKDKAGKELPDKVCNGAIDNAAGVAVTLFVGYALKAAAHKPRRSVTLCLFDAEEDGLLGSKHMVAQIPAAQLATIAAMLSVDNVGSRIFPQHSSSFATDAEFSKALRQHVLDTNKATGFTTWPVSSFFVGKEGGGRSDHWPFREKGVPVLFVGSGSTSVYHTVHDQPAALDFGKLHNIARHTVQLVARIANADEKPDFTADPQPHLDDARAMVSIADKVIADPSGLGLNQAQVDLVKQWRGELQQWLDKPPTTDAQWTEYQTLVKAIIAAVYAFGG